MISYFGDFAEDDTVLIPFNTFDSNDPSASVTITNLADADIMVHKDGGLTQIATDGATVVIDFDGITGNHMITIDTSAHADYSTGSEYAVRIEGTTVDAATINAWVGSFSIERAGGALALCKLIQAATITNAAGTDIAADIIAVKAETVSILEDTGTTLDTKLDNIQGTSFNTSTDSLRAIRVNGDSLWTGDATTSDAGTAQAGGLATITLRNGAPADIADQLNGQVIYISSGTGAGQSRAIKSYNIDVPTAPVATTISNWAIQPDATSVYAIYPDEITEITAAPTAAANAAAVWDLNVAGHQGGSTFGEKCSLNIDAILVDTQTTLDSAIAVIDANVDQILLDTAEIGTAGAGLTNINLPNQTMDITGNITGNLSGSVGSVTGAVGSVTGAVGSVTGAVGSVAGNVVGSVGSVTGHTAQTGDTYALANGATGFAAIDTVVDAVKAKTDSLTFTKANEVDANAQSINGAAVVGDGNATPWDGA
jgi:hypothetical protein